MKSGVATRLSIMMFLQYAIWGAWAPILTLHLLSLPDFSKADAGWLIGLVFMTMAIASMVAPVAGQLADRYFSTERFLAFSLVVAGGLIIWVYFLQSFWSIFLVMLLHTLFYAPTVGLTNSIALHHLPDRARDFGRVRLWGTVGWIVIAWAFSVWLGLADGLIGMASPGTKESIAGWREGLSAMYKPNVGQTLLVAGGLSFVLAGFCLTLPHTPPTRKAVNPFAFLGAVKLMRQPSFAVLMVVAFLVSTELQFYYVFTPQFFNQGGGPFDSKEIAGAMLKKWDTPASYDASELIRQWDEKKLVLWDQRTLTREELASLKPALRDAILNSIYKPQLESEAEDMIYIGDAKEMGGNGDGKLSRAEFHKVKTLKFADIQEMANVAARQILVEEEKIEAHPSKEVRKVSGDKLAFLRKRQQTIGLMILSGLMEQHRTATDPQDRAALWKEVVEQALAVRYFRDQAWTAADLAAYSGLAIPALAHYEAEIREPDLTADQKQAYDNNLIQIHKRLGRFDERQPTISKMSLGASQALSRFDDVADNKGGLKLDQAWVGPVMTFGQIAEVAVLLLVPFSLRKLGYRYTIAIGIFAWSLRYVLFSLGQPRELIIASQALHGFGFAFFFVGAFLYADAVATPDIRASAQSFIIFMTYGAGMLVSSLFAGPVVDAFDKNWHLVFMVPAIITAVCTVVFILGFKDPPGVVEPPPPKPKDALTEFIEKAEQAAREQDSKGT